MTNEDKLVARLLQAVRVLHAQEQWTVASVAAAAGIARVPAPTGVRTVDGVVRQAAPRSGPFARLGIVEAAPGLAVRAFLDPKTPFPAQSVRSAFVFWTEEGEGSVRLHVHALECDQSEPPTELALAVDAADRVLRVALRRTP